MIGYELRAAYAGTVLQRTDGDDPGTEVPVFQGGLITAGDRDLNIGELLEEGDGRIYVEDSDAAAILALDEYPALKRTTVADGAEATVNTVAEAYADRNRDELRAEADSRGIEGAKSSNKPELVIALEEHDRRLADRSLDELGAPISVIRLAQAAGEREVDETTDSDGDDAGAEA